MDISSRSNHFASGIGKRLIRFLESRSQITELGRLTSVLDPYFEVLWEGVKINFSIFFFIGTFATKRFVRPRIFRYGLPKDILSDGQTKMEGGGPGALCSANCISVWYFAARFLCMYVCIIKDYISM